MSDTTSLVRPEDDSLHENDGDVFWNESSWVGFNVADHSLSGIFYFYHRPNMKFTQGGVILWDPSGEETYDCLVYDWNLHEFEPGFDMFDFSLPNGLTVKCEEPLKKFAFTYRGKSCRIDMRWEGFMEPFQTGMPNGATEWASKGHYQQGGRATGELTVEGRTYEIDCLSLRDHSWGRRRVVNDSRGDLLWAASSEDHMVCLYVVGDDSEGVDHANEVVDPVGAGWYLKDGEVRPVFDGKRRVRRGDKGRLVEVSVEGEDDKGRSFRAEGRPINLLLWHGYPATMMFYSLVRYEFDGVPAIGESTDYWPVETSARMIRALRSAT